MKTLAFLASAAALTVSAPSAATVVLDQDNLMTVSAGNGAYSGLLGQAADYRQAQIVVAGVNGILSRVDLQVRRAQTATGALILEIVSLPLPTATGTGVVVGGLTTAVDGQTVSVDVSSLNFAVTAGSSFALFLHSDTVSNANRYGWLFGENDVDGNLIYTRNYAPGANNLYNVYAPGEWGESGADRGFATYVDVPEPASWALMIAGFGMVGGAQRLAGRRKRAVA